MSSFRDLKTALSALAGLGLAFAGPGAQAGDRFYSVLVDGPGMAIASPMLVVGLEKESRQQVGAIDTDQDGCAGKDRCLYLGRAAGPAQVAGATLVKRRENDKPLFVSHIVVLPGANAVDVVYSAYEAAAPGDKLRLKSNDGVDRSWPALDNDLRRAITDRLEEACKIRCVTHIVLMSTGWRTPQDKAIKHHQEWAGVIKQELRQKDSDAEPMFIGLTWPSTWRIPTASFLNKAHDADEAGYIWGAALLHRVLAPVAEENDLQIVLVGHSFGARLLTSAVAGRPFVAEGDCRAVGQRILTVGLEAAFSTGRFTGLGKEGGPYGDLTACGGRFAFVASRHDEGVKLAPMEIVARQTAYMGGNNGLEMSLKAPLVFKTVSASAQGRISALWDTDDLPRRVLVIDASDGVRCHNDVYDKFAGRLIANLIAGDPSGRPGLPHEDHVCPFYKRDRP